MLKDPAPKQHTLEMVTLEELVPQDHLLRLIDQHIDFEFIREVTAPMYCENNGRPAIDPVLLFKMLFIGYLFGIRSERQLVREVQVNVAYRWFLGLNLTDNVPNASTFSQNRRRRFEGTDIEQTIFDEIVEQALEKGLIGGKALYTDSTHLKASANKNRHSTHEVAITPMAYLDELNEAIEADRQAHGKKPLKARSQSVATKPTKISDTDPDAGYMVRDKKPEGFFYLDHRTVDGKHGLITDTHVTPGNINDARPYLERLDRQCERFQLNPIKVGLDAGYNTAAICHGLVKRGIDGVVGYKRPHSPVGRFKRRHFTYDPIADEYRCPQGETLPYSTTSRDGYREYKSNPKICKDCPLRDQCTQSRNHQKVMVRHVWEEDREEINQNRYTDWGRKVYQRRQETVERSFADAKELHGHRYARYRGLSRVKGQCLLAAACQNMKKIARLLAALYWLWIGREWLQNAGYRASGQFRTI
ncbi:IS1182 family transposase [Parahaliea maris]|uniref:IS1182 family transposase n=1 Tax=Parahaliea maris TaxID=2716870 RepID=UPI001F3FD852|nr:IS1182 family transposase [Parahaliea maris]